MEILGYVIVKCPMGYELRPGRYADNCIYLSSTLEGIFGYLRMNGAGFY